MLREFWIELINVHLMINNRNRIIAYSGAVRWSLSIIFQINGEIIVGHEQTNWAEWICIFVPESINKQIGYFFELNNLKLKFEI